VRGILNPKCERKLPDYQLIIIYLIPSFRN
jgi:hypothetical protein